METDKNKQSSVELKDPLLFHLRFAVMAPIVVSPPAISLFVCFVTAMLYQFDEVNLTMCKVKNYIPSISAVTGAAPQRYIWRTCIGLHTPPRFIVGVMYYRYYMSRLNHVVPSRQSLYHRLAKVTFWVYTVENTCLFLVSIVANYENYPVHEKIFMVFMFTSMFHQCFVVLLFSWAHPNKTPQMARSYRQKCVYFWLCLASTAGLVVFFIKHRVFCEAGAFSWFSLCEYFIAYFNIGFHFTAWQDFADAALIVCSPLLATTTNHESVHAVTANGSKHYERRDNSGHLRERVDANGKKWE